MPIEVTCQCGQRFAAPSHLAGQSTNCPVCGAVIAIPAQQTQLTQPTPQATSDMRCQFCHQYIKRSLYDHHVQEHLKLQADGQQAEYATLPPEQRTHISSNEFANAPQWYRHNKCGQVTGMPEEIIRTYLKDPWFYLSDKTFCTGCGKHVRQRECVWEETGENLQTYTDRLRDAKPHLRPGLLKRAFGAVVNALFG